MTVKTVKSTITNLTNNQTQTFYSITDTLEEAVSRHLQRVEESTPIGELPDKYLITVEIV